MTSRKKLAGYAVAASVGTILIFGLGCLFMIFMSNSPVFGIRKLTRNSYDWSFNLTAHLQPRLTNCPVVIVYIDEPSLKELDQPLDAPMDRSLHARLLERLKLDGARAVIMDIVFSGPGPDPKKDELLAKAMHDMGRVALATELVESHPQAGTDVSITDFATKQQQTGNKQVLKQYGFALPYSLFLENAATNGLSSLHAEDDLMVRQHYHGESDVPSISWAAARMLKLHAARIPAERWVQRWVKYYGPAYAIPSVSYWRALDPKILPAGFFRNKIVFVGAHTITGEFNEVKDEFKNPYKTRIDTEFERMPGVEVHATEFLNLFWADWLEQSDPYSEIGILALSSVILGVGLLLLRPPIATLAALLIALAVVVIAQWYFIEWHIWFPWLVVVAQIPVALIYSVTIRWVEAYLHERKLVAHQRLSDMHIKEQAALLDKAHDAIIVHDLNWRAQYWNQGASLLYGWSPDEIRDKDLKLEVFKTEEGKLLEALQHALASGEWSGVLNQTNRAGKPITVQSRWTLVRDEKGRPKSIFVINTDITEQRSLEAQFLRTQRMESIGTLAGGIAHDLNNVLSPILMGLELIKMKLPLDESTNKMLTTMSVSAKRGSDMVKQVLTFARGVEGERTILQISHLIREMQKITRETFPKNIEVKMNIGEIPPILGDATQIHQILLNLCVNARDAMPDGGGITVSARAVTLTEDEAKGLTAGAKPGAFVLLSVADTGTGIPPEIIDKIFEPFFTTKEIGKGTGLGLSTVITIIKSHGGFLDLKSEVGKGTSFNIYLPAAANVAPPSTAAVSLDKLRGRGETILIVDDEIAILEVTKAVLANHGYKTVTAANGADAMALFPQYGDKVAAAIVDMMMPVMDGTATIKALKRERPALKCIAISGLMQEDKTKNVLGGDAAVFLNKPFTAEKLLQVLHELLAENSTATSPKTN